MTDRPPFKIDHPDIPPPMVVCRLCGGVIDEAYIRVHRERCQS